MRFATLHVTKVDAAITVRRGLDAATIVSARAPARVRAGHTLEVRLRTQIYRGPIRSFHVPAADPRDDRSHRDPPGATSPSLGPGGDAGLEVLLSGLFGGGGPAAGPRAEVARGVEEEVRGRSGLRRRARRGSATARPKRALPQPVAADHRQDGASVLVVAGSRVTALVASEPVLDAERRSPSSARPRAPACVRPARPRFRAPRAARPTRTSRRRCRRRRASSPSTNSCGIVGQLDSADSSWRIRGSGRMSTAANGWSTDLRIATVRAEKPHAGWFGVPFMNRITWFSSIAVWIASRRGLLVVAHEAASVSEALVWIANAWMRPPSSSPNTSYTRRCWAIRERPLNAGEDTTASKWCPSPVTSAVASGIPASMRALSSSGVADVGAGQPQG